MKANEFDRRFEEDDDLTDYLDLGKAKRPNLEQKRVNVDFPTWMIGSFDREAKRIGVTRQALIKMWLAERLDETSERADIRANFQDKDRKTRRAL